MSNVSVKFSAPIKERVNQCAERLGLDVSDVIQLAVANHLPRLEEVFFKREIHQKQDGAFRFEIVTCDEHVLDLGSNVVLAAPSGRMHSPFKTEWMRLGRHQCPTCPLRGSESQWCPAAVSMEPVVNSFCARKFSHEIVMYEYERDEIICRKTGDLQAALGIALFYRLSSSGCPNLALDHWALKYFSPDFTAGGLWFSQWCINLVLKEISRENGITIHSEIKNTASFREVFECMLHRVNGLKEIEADAIANALIHVHSVMVLAGELSASMRDDLIAEIGCSTNHCRTKRAL